MVTAKFIFSYYKRKMKPNFKSFGSYNFLPELSTKDLWRYTSEGYSCNGLKWIYYVINDDCSFSIKYTILHVHRNSKWTIQLENMIIIPFDSNLIQKIEVVFRFIGLSTPTKKLSFSQLMNEYNAIAWEYKRYSTSIIFFFLSQK